MYKLSAPDAATLGKEIIEMAGKVEHGKAPLIMLYSEKMGTTFTVDSDDSGGYNDFDIVFEVIP
jgi:hypothetical protein